MFHPSPCIPLSLNRALILALSLSHSFSLLCFLSDLFSSSAAQQRRERETVLDWRFYRTPPLAGVPRSRRIDQTRADPGSTREAERPGRLHQDGKQPRAPFESPLGGEGNRLSRGSSVPAGGNGPTHRFAQPRRTPLVRSRPEKRRRDAPQTRPRFFFLFLSPGVSLSLSPCLILSPSLVPSSFRCAYGVRVRASRQAYGGTDRRRG